eukprot:GHVQ01004874.1.p1 GENE.GHVQ01004874.1~~GHVQ01004874.1.p1  ORF type:complete len:600 (-),score=106.89 GHVQ01004874.1:792-2591(-)
MECAAGTQCLCACGCFPSTRTPHVLRTCVTTCVAHMCNHRYVYSGPISPRHNVPSSSVPANTAVSVSLCLSRPSVSCGGEAGGATRCSAAESSSGRVSLCGEYSASEVREYREALEQLDVSMLQEIDSQSHKMSEIITGMEKTVSECVSQYEEQWKRRKEEMSESHGWGLKWGGPRREARAALRGMVAYIGRVCTNAERVAAHFLRIIEDAEEETTKQACGGGDRGTEVGQEKNRQLGDWVESEFWRKLRSVRKPLLDTNIGRTRLPHNNSMPALPDNVSKRSSKVISLKMPSPHQGLEQHGPVPVLDSTKDIPTLTELCVTARDLIIAQHSDCVSPDSSSAACWYPSELRYGLWLTTWGINRLADVLDALVPKAVDQQGGNDGSGRNGGGGQEGGKGQNSRDRKGAVSGVGGGNRVLGTGSGEGGGEGSDQESREETAPCVMLCEERAFWDTNNSDKIGGNDSGYGDGQDGREDRDAISYSLRDAERRAVCLGKQWLAGGEDDGLKVKYGHKLENILQTAVQQLTAREGAGDGSGSSRRSTKTGGDGSTGGRGADGGVGHMGAGSGGGGKYGEELVEALERLGDGERNMVSLDWLCCI